MKRSLLMLTVLAACGAPTAQPVAVPKPASSPDSSARPVPPTASASAAASVHPPTMAAPQPRFTTRPIALPGATGPVSLDYLASDRATGRVWIPAGDTGSVDVLDVASGAVTRIKGFPTAEREIRGHKRLVGPSSASIGDGVVYAGNRANSEVCVIDSTRLVRGSCIALASSPDGILYVGATRELWVTTPRDKSITILDASAPPRLWTKMKIVFDGEPEGYAVDNGRGIFYTNLEDKDKTLAIDVRTRKVVSTWSPQCGSDGPRGLAVDSSRGLLFVACTDHLQVLDTAHDGALLSRLDTGAGVDNIDYLEARQLLYVAAGKAARLTIAQVGDKGAVETVATVVTSEGARTVVADRDGNAVVGDPAQGRVLLITPTR